MLFKKEVIDSNKKLKKIIRKGGMIMSNEELNSVIDRAEDEYQKLKDKVIEQQEEIERLNKGYCKFKRECGKYATCLRENQLKEIERLNNKLKDIKSQLDYLETYSSKEDVFEDMKRRLDRIENIVNRK